MVSSLGAGRDEPFFAACLVISSRYSIPTADACPRAAGAGARRGPGTPPGRPSGPGPPFSCPLLGADFDGSRIERRLRHDGPADGSPLPLYTVERKGPLA